MTIVSLSFAYLQVTSTVANRDTPPAPAAPKPEPVAQPSCRHADCDSPRRSPLYQALKNALLEMTQPAASPAPAPASGAAAAQTTASGATTTAAAGAAASAKGQAPSATTQAAATNDAAAPDLDDAVMDFARALMQALHAAFAEQRRRGDDDRHDGGHRHHRHHDHHHGHRAYADPAQRVESLASAIAPASAAPTTPTPPDAAQVPEATTATTAPALDAVTPSATGGTTTVVTAAVRLEIANASAPASVSGFQQRLLDAFASLQQALGKPAAADGDALKSDLATFLQTLAQKLRGDEAASAAAASPQPGTLLRVSA
jgi:hypothetical protein